jgi:MFS family permease
VRRLGPALGERDFRLWFYAVLAMWISLQMLEVAIGWEVYAQHRTPLDLGLIGLAEFVPLFLLALPAGQLADRAPRRLVFAGALLLAAGVACGLALVSSAGDRSVIPYLALAFGAGIATAFAFPAARAMPPTLVPPELLPNAMTLRSIATQTGQVTGPALGGLLYNVSATLVYLLAGGALVLSAAIVLAMRPRPAADPAAAAVRAQRAQQASVESVLEGLRFVRRTQILLGAILLDLLAVLFGGAVALLPVFARSILHTGATGLGVLRAAPSLGSLIGAIVLTRRPMGGRVGRLLLNVVALYGVAMIVFGLSRSYPLSFAALAFSGFVDLYSMNIRSTTVALATPDRLRGRVNAVEMVFISASNQLGAFESGVSAALIGTVPAVVIGGAITISLAVGWHRVFPALSRIDRLEQVRPDEPDPVAAVAPSSA